MEEELLEEERADTLREYWREKYYRRVEGKVTQQLAKWLKDESIKPSFKVFIRECVWSNKAKCPMAIIKILSDLDIALENSKKKSDEIVDGKRSEHRIEGRGKSQDEEDSENSPTEDDSSSQGEEASQGEERETYIQYSSTINNFML